MKRREFLAVTCLASLSSGVTNLQAAERKRKSRKQFYELRRYLIKTNANKKQVLDFLKAAELPALNRLGIEPVGVFEIIESDSNDVYVLLPSRSVRPLISASSLLESDAEYLQAGASMFKTTKADVPYERIESTLMLAFDGIPKLELPTSKESRVFQLRIYESHNLLAAKKKIEMFNTGGELAIFRKTGLNPVFFGKSLIGNKLPNLTYMLGFDNMAAKEKGWDTFRNDPEWKKLKENSYYKDTVSNITNILLRPTQCSQI
jgi:hypothetical protein